MDENPIFTILDNKIDGIKTVVDEIREDQKDWKKRIEDRLRSLEDWRLVFVAKFSVYSALALFLGSAVAQIMIYFITKKL